MNDEPKSPAEMKEIRLNRKAAQDAEGIKAMADIAAADIAIRKRTADVARCVWRGKPKSSPIRLRRSSRPEPKGQGESQAQEKEDELDDKRRSQPRRGAFQQGDLAKDARSARPTATRPTRPCSTTWPS